MTYRFKLNLNPLDTFDVVVKAHRLRFIYLL